MASSSPSITIELTVPLELDAWEREAIALVLETGEQQILLDECEAAN